MGKIICTITSWWQKQKENIRETFEIMYLFYTSPVELEIVPVTEMQQNFYR